ncbi:MAG: hypothetical protein ACJ8AO_07405 [Gemmatimonadaceae bacterium]
MRLPAPAVAALLGATALGAQSASVPRGTLVGSRVATAAGAPVVLQPVDGQVKEWGHSLDSVQSEEVHGIEIYSGPASIPSEFGGARTDACCGLVMIWTRAR